MRKETKPEQSGADAVADAPVQGDASAEVAAPEVGDALSEAVSRGVHGWAVKHLHNSAFSRETAAWNHFQKGLPALVESIVGEIKSVAV